MSEEILIQIEDIEAIVKKLRDLDLKWADKLAPKMGVNVLKVRYVVSGIAKTQAIRALFCQKAMELYEELAEKHKDVVKEMKDFINNDKDAA